MPLDLSHLLSEEAKARQASKLKGLGPYRFQKDMCFLGTGLPLSDYFAWESIEATTKLPPFSTGLTRSATDEKELSFKVDYEGANDITLDKSLQYGNSAGPDQLRDFLKEHTKLVHDIAYDDWDLVTTVGSTQAWDSCIRAFCNRGKDSILVEEYAFSSALETASPFEVDLIPMKMDKDGVVPEALEQKLAKMKMNNIKIPKLMYVVPTGHNPTGRSIPEDRRKAIYNIASKYDFIIVEDEPYYFLQLDPYEYSNESRIKIDGKIIDTKEFLSSLIPSFLKYDTDGRVIRLDSFSKILAPGCRLGWLIGQKPLLERFIRNFETSFQLPSGFASSIIYGTLSRWGQQGYLDWLKALRKEYSYKRNIAMDSCYKYLPKEICIIDPPIAGMFFTISVDTSKHPKYSNDPLLIEKKIHESSIAHNTILAPGSWFEVLEKDSVPNKIIFFRGTYAATNDDILIEGIRRFGLAIENVFKEV